MSRIVVALGGNALGKTPFEQLNLVKHTAKSLVELIAKGNEVIITHGNGPQVGMINLAFETASLSETKSPEMPFPECGAMSQGYIGYHLQNAIYAELKNQKINKKVATIVTQVVVDKDDGAFTNPTKPIGSFYNKEEADKIEKEKGYIFKEDSGRGWRRVVPSPKPVDVVEKDIVNTLVNAGHIVITVGGGGIPVIEENGQLTGVSAVIDKDFASSKIAEILDADYLFILTAVDKVSINFNKPNQIDLDSLTVEKAKEYILENHFAKGSMLPKIEAAMSFAASKKGRVAVIASLEKVKAALDGKSGTKVTL
ncbi:carbamate kinase [Mycoplasmatota bacterium]|nr:carbamate kinase [Mycoplasmatota bacterium]